MQLRLIISIILGFILIAALVLIGKQYMQPKETVQNQETAAPQTTQPTPSDQPTAATPLSLQSLNIGLKIPPNTSIGIFAKNVPGARDLELTPNNVLIVSLPDAGEVRALIDDNQDGVADTTKTVIKGLNRPHGLTFYQDKLYVAQETRVTRYTWDQANNTATLDRQIISLPGGGRHSTRTLAFDTVGKLYISLGSSCDVCIEKEPWLGTVIQTDKDGNDPRVFASGLRNEVFITINPKTGALWGTEMSRDNLGDNIPADEINIIQEKKNYGWPKCYGNKIHDTQFDKSSTNPCENTEPPLYEIPAHSAPLGLTFTPEGDLLVAYHGSWNRTQPTGYKIVKLSVGNNTITKSEDYISGFLDNTTVKGRPVDLIFDQKGRLYISDDKEGAVYILAPN